MATTAEKENRSPKKTGWFRYHFVDHFFDTGDNDHLSGYELFFIFVVSSVVGSFVEILYGLITNGYFERRTSLVYGEFGFAYAIGGTVLTLLLFKNTRTAWWKVFLKSFVVCSIAEYIMSWGEELLFHHVSWDYSNMPLNLNGRICFLYSCFWGILGLVWAKLIYPGLKQLAKKLPKQIGQVLFWILLVFLTYDIIITVCAVTAFNRRQEGIPPRNSYEQLMERQFPDSFMISAFPNAYSVKDGKRSEDTLNDSNAKAAEKNPLARSEQKRQARTATATLATQAALLPRK